MIVGVILLRTECQFNGWQGQAKGRNGEEASCFDGARLPNVLRDSQGRRLSSEM